MRELSEFTHLLLPAINSGANAICVFRALGTMRRILEKSLGPAHKIPYDAEGSLGLRTAGGRPSTNPSASGLIEHRPMQGGMI